MEVRVDADESKLTDFLKSTGAIELKVAEIN